MSDLKDEIATLSGKCLHRMSEDVKLLKDALHAAERHPPKIHVVVDHLERVIYAMEKEISNLKWKERIVHPD